MTNEHVDVSAQIEAIKQLKARYCRFLDTKSWDEWRLLFTDDFVSDTSDAGGRVIQGADEFVGFTRRILDKPSRVTVHRVHNPEIELTSPTTAVGVWVLSDIVRMAPFVNLRGYGRYHETYVRGEHDWLIASSRLTRLREDLFNGLFSITLSKRVRDALAARERRTSSMT